MFLILSLLACTSNDYISEPNFNQLALVNSTGDTIDTGSLDEVVILGAGQSNMCSQNMAPVDFPHSLTGDHTGVTLIRNGFLKTSYGPKIPVDPFIVDELMDAGYLASQITLVMRCAQGTSINYSRDTLVPGLIEDLITWGISEPDLFIFWQGEFEAGSSNPDFSSLYESDLLGFDGAPNLYDSLHDIFPNMRWSVIELAFDNEDMYPYIQQQRVRTAQQLAGTIDGVCTIPTYGATFPSTTNPHPDLLSVEDIARRATKPLITGRCR